MRTFKEIKAHYNFTEAEIRTFSSANRVKNALLNFSERFSQVMNLVLGVVFWLVRRSEEKGRE